MASYDFLALLGIAAISCGFSCVFVPPKAGVVLGFLGMFLIAVQLGYTVIVSPVHMPISLGQLSELILSPARLGVALGLAIAIIPHALKRPQN